LSAPDAPAGAPLRLTPAPALTDVTAYAVPRAGAPIDLHLDGNEGAWPDPSLLQAAAGVDRLRRYPSARPLEAALAVRLGVSPEAVLVTAGGDEGIDRACRVMLRPDRDEVVLPEPTFEMIHRYARLSGGRIVGVPWGASWPRAAVLEAISARTALVFVVSPNNPTGQVASVDDVRAVAQAAPEALVVLDHAYVEFANADFTRAVLDLPNVLVIRTFAKAWGLAGLRVGYAVGHPRVVGWLRAAGGPYPVAGPSLAVAEAALAGDLDAFVATVREERASLTTMLAGLGATPTASEANFVFARVRDPLWLRDGMAGLGVGVRAFPGKPGLADAVRVTCPGRPDHYARLAHGLAAVLAPEAVLLDMDGVLADVSRSYRAAIVGTCHAFGVAVTLDDISAVKAEGDANNDWVVSQRLLARRGVDISLSDVTATFERLYQGTPDTPGRWTTETLIPAVGWLARLAGRVRVGIVTGRPRKDAARFLAQHGLEVAAVVCMEDGPLKPDPWPVRRCMALLGVRRAWMVGDTVDDVRAARAAGAVPLGVRAPGDTGDGASLTAAGAARVLDRLEDLEALLP
jgi:histidinol-phosphate aminotransferase